MKIFVTGGAGYVGSACLRYLVAKGHDAVAYDNLCEGHRSAVPDGRLIEGDIRDTAAMTQAMRSHGSEAVMHFAAGAYVNVSVEDPQYYYENNVAGSLSVLRAMRECRIERIVFSSTCATYGDNPTVPVGEDEPQVPCSPYGRTKLNVEWILKDFAAAYGIGATALRYFNASGADGDGQHGEDHEPETHLIPLVLQVALGQRQSIKIFGSDYPTADGTCVRDYVHTYDLASAHLLALEVMKPGRFDAFNIGTGKGHSVLEVIEACRKVTGHAIPAEAAGRRAGDATALYADSRKLRQLGWEPRFESLEEIVKTAWAWHQSHPQGYED